MRQLGEIYVKATVSENYSHVLSEVLSGIFILSYYFRIIF